MLNSAEERLQALRVLDKEAAWDGIDGEVSETSHIEFLVSFAGHATCRG